MKKYLLIILVFTVLTGYSQSKKNAKKNSIKSATTWIVEQKSGKLIPMKDSYEEFDRNGNTLSKIEYSKKGAIKKKETYKFNSDGKKIEETEYEPGKKFEKRVYTYNAFKDVSSVTEYDSTGNMIKKTVFEYNADGDKSIENISNSSGKESKKYIYKYLKKGLKSERQQFNNNNELESIKKWEYEYF